MPDSYTVVIPGEPCAKGRPRFSKKTGHAYTPQKTVSWEGRAQAVMMAAVKGGKPLEGPLALKILAVFTCPKTDHRKREPRKRRWHTKNKDLDNIIKAVADAGNGVLWLDDRQVCHVIANKWIGAQGEAPRVEFTVLQLNERP